MSHRTDDVEVPNSGASDPDTKLRKDGQPDRRFKEHGGGQHGMQGTSPEMEGDGTSALRTDPNSVLGEDTNTHKPSLHGGRREDGQQDSRVSSEHGFGGDRQLASEAGKKGGSASYDNGGLDA